MNRKINDLEIIFKKLLLELFIKMNEQKIFTSSRHKLPSIRVIIASNINDYFLDNISESFFCVKQTAPNSEDFREPIDVAYMYQIEHSEHGNTIFSL